MNLVSVSSLLANMRKVITRIAMRVIVTTAMAIIEITKSMIARRTNATHTNMTMPTTIIATRVNITAVVQIITTAPPQFAMPSTANYPMSPRLSAGSTRATPTEACKAAVHAQLARPTSTGRPRDFARHATDMSSPLAR